MLRGMWKEHGWQWKELPVAKAGMIEEQKKVVLSYNPKTQNKYPWRYTK